ncbi:MAG: YqgE/AlgH family protein [Pseudomonadota bacterium]
MSTPGLRSSMFADSIIFVCAHNTDGCMGFIINKPNVLTMEDLIERVDGLEDNPQPPMARAIAHPPLRCGGPVDENRGFILHSPDYENDATIPISETVSLTSTMTVLRDVLRGCGPKKAMVTLGYSSWDADQIEDELRSNYWLALEADHDMIFERAFEDKYTEALAQLGIHSRAGFVGDVGHA